MTKKSPKHKPTQVYPVPGNPNKFQIESSDGSKLYTVTRFGSVAVPPIWVCSCPAGNHGKPCKHIPQVKRVAVLLDAQTPILQEGDRVEVKAEFQFSEDVDCWASKTWKVYRHGSYIGTVTETVKGWDHSKSKLCEDNHPSREAAARALWMQADRDQRLHERTNALFAIA